MYLEGQGSQRGYAMAALLVALGVMAVLMSVALPVWRQQAQREKEAELVFRGEQYARAIGLYQRKTGSFPTNIDVLVTQRFLRKKYKDPMTEDGEFTLIPASAVGGGTPLGPNPGGQIPGRGQGSAGATGRIPTPSGTPQGSGGSGGFSLGAGLGGPFMGVQSKSKEASIRVYKGRTHYNEWQFLIAVSNRPGGGVGGPGGRAGPGGIGRPDGRGRGDGRGGPDGRGRGPGGFRPGGADPGPFR